MVCLLTVSASKPHHINRTSTALNINEKDSPTFRVNILSRASCGCTRLQLATDRRESCFNLARRFSPIWCMVNSYIPPNYELMCSSKNIIPQHNTKGPSKKNKRERGLPSRLQARDAILIQVSDSINGRIHRERLNAKKRGKIKRKGKRKYPILH